MPFDCTSSCSLLFSYFCVILLEQPRRLQYSGLLVVGYKVSLKEKSGSRLMCLFPVSAVMSSNWRSIFPKGEMYFSVFFDSSQFSQELLMGTSTSLLKILATSRRDSSVRLTSKGSTFNSTSRASLPLVPMTPKHKARPFLCTYSSLDASAHCHTGQVYSRTGRTNALYKCISFFVLIFSTCLTCLSVLTALLAFCSTLEICLCKFKDSSNTTPSNFGVELYFIFIFCCLVWLVAHDY